MEKFLYLSEEWWEKRELWEMEVKKQGKLMQEENRETIRDLRRGWKLLVRVGSLDYYEIVEARRMVELRENGDIRVVI